MGLFNRKAKGFLVSEDDTYRLHQPTLDDATESMKATAIEYIVSLGKADKDKFFESTELIWQGYQIMDNVKTKHQKALHREAKQAGLEDDSDLIDLLDDEPNKPNPLVTPPKADAKKVEVK